MSCERQLSDLRNLVNDLYSLGNTIGKGHFAVVKIARHVFTQKEVAVKVIDKTKLDEISRIHLLQEVECMKLVQHPNVVRLYEVIDTSNKLYLILELADGGDMYDYISKHVNGLNESLARRYFRQICQALKYCHKMYVCHRDLKTIRKTVFPDFLYPPAHEWWKSQIVDYHTKLKFDGLWIDMNEPANFDTNKEKPWNWNRPEPWNLHCPVDSESLDKPPYKTAICGDYLSDKTLCMIGEQADGQGKIYHHYDVHSLYGWSETIATLPAARATENKRSIIISRSTFPTSGSFSGHWLGDNTADWSHLKHNIIGMLEFNLFGIPYIGADICGYFRDTTEQLCQRWMQLGAFNPFFRNHNGFNYIDQDPGIFSTEVVTSNRHAVELRYSLNPYLYTLFHRVHISGGTVVRSMTHEFPSIPECWSLDEQFLWGPSLLIAPVIYENHVNKSIYLPTTERWFDYYTGQEQTILAQITVSAPYNFIPLFLRGGAIIPHQQSAMNTVLSRKKPMYLIIALNTEQRASGDLFWDDGESIDTYENLLYNYFIFNFNSQRLTLEPWTYNYPQMGNDVKLNEIKVFGMNKRPTTVIWNGQNLIASKWTFDTTKNVLHMQMLALNMAKIQKFVFI
ncbi:unnamed protein product [Rotaria sp. Silwood2]|nr:unnamed protein product [Rotaria sp. Silwood2]